MTLTSGAKLGPYEILSAIGAGGQGEVYKARDTRLNRTVAIKVLPSHFSDNAEMKARFEMFPVLRVLQPVCLVGMDKGRQLDSRHNTTGESPDPPHALEDKF